MARKRGRKREHLGFAEARATGPTSTRDGRLRAAISELIALARENADHLAACVLDPHGNPIGTPLTIPAGRPWAGADVERRSAARWPAFPPPASANACAA
ncbi:hypothetical protein QFZ74_004230 [Streptomyces sp. V3I7]|nr:hypothetical protein [Streptomyces sp. V3I7]